MSEYLSYEDAEEAHNEFKNAKDEGKHEGHPKTIGAIAFLALTAHDHKTGKKTGTGKKLLESAVIAEVGKLVEEKVIPDAEAEWHKHEALKHAHAISKKRYGSEY